MIKKLMPVSTIQEVLNETETNGIESGLAKFKESAFYKSLSDKQKALIDSEGITKLMQEQVILHREDQINKKKTAVEKAKEQTSKKEKEIAFNKIEKIHENYKNKIEELRKSNKSYREKVAERKRQAKEAYDNTVIFLNQNMISGKITPTEVSRLLKAATGILSTRNSISNFNKFTELFNKINAKAEERNKTQIERTTDKYNEVSQSVEQQFNSGKSLQEVKDSFNSIDEQRMVESAYNRLANKTISPEEARKKLDDSYKSSKEVLTKRFKDENGNVLLRRNEKINAWRKKKFESFMTKSADRQFIPKRILENIGASPVVDRMIAYSGTSTKAKEEFKKVDEKVYEGLNVSELELLDKIISAKRFIAIDKNREGKGLPVVDHPGYQDASTAQKALDAYKSEIGEDTFSKLAKRANAYFDAFKSLLSDMRESGLISNEAYEELKDVDYQPRKFLRYILDADGELMSSDRTMFRNENGNLSKEQIIGLSEGDASDMLMDSKWLIQSALTSRYKAIGMNEVNRTFFTKYYPDAKAKFESINPDNIPEGDKKFYKYFKQLQSNIKENRIIGFTESGKPKYEITTPEGYKIAYYYENGVRHQVFMKEEFHKMWHDTMDKLINSKTANIIGWVSGSKIIKSFATGNNPFFFITNTPRDFGHTLLFSEEYNSFLLTSAAKLTKDSIKAIGEIYKHNNTDKDNLLSKYIQYGGGMEWLNQQGEIKDLTSLTNTISYFIGKQISPKIKNILDTIFSVARLKFMANYSETMFRVAVFDRSLQNQLKEYNKLNNTTYKSVEELSKEVKDNMYYRAVSSSRGLLDFNQGGTFTKAGEAAIPYLNAATQGTRVALQTINKRPIATTVRLLQAGAGSVAFMASLAQLLIAAFRPPEKNKETVEKSYIDFLDGISPSQKQNYWNIPIGWSKESKQWKILKVAKTEFLTPLTTAMEGLYEDYLRGKNGYKKRGTGKILDNTIHAFSEKVDPLHFTSVLKNPTSIQGLGDSAAEVLSTSPLAKGVIQSKTGYDLFRNQPLSFDIGKVPRTYEGESMKNVEEFYKKLGKTLDGSPVRMKAFVESFVTSPSTNPFVGVMYGGADAIATDVSAKEKVKNLYEQSIKRLINETTDFNVQLSKKSLIEDELKQNEIQIAKIKSSAKKIYDKYGSKELIMKNINVIKTEIAKETKDPEEQKMMSKRIKSLMDKEGIEPMVFDIKYGANNNKNKAILIYSYLEGMTTEQKTKFKIQLKTQKVLTKNVKEEYVKYKNEVEGN
ncbi:LPD38 domain-containing protein [Elizabethkingia anophelis]|nr:LPD38 domain-containing protein [Elizabethkingia anophelis]